MMTRVNQTYVRIELSVILLISINPFPIETIFVLICSSNLGKDLTNSGKIDCFYTLNNFQQTVCWCFYNTYEVIGKTVRYYSGVQYRLDWDCYADLVSYSTYFDLIIESVTFTCHQSQSKFNRCGAIHELTRVNSRSTNILDIVVVVLSLSS